eukprot:5956639-Amphidinium_carterae.1
MFLLFGGFGCWTGAKGFITPRALTPEGNGLCRSKDAYSRNESSYIWDSNSAVETPPKGPNPQDTKMGKGYSPHRND